MATTKAQPSLIEKLDTMLVQLALLGTALYHAITGFFRDDRSPSSYKLHISHAVLRKALSRLSTSQLQSLIPPFRVCYEKFCREKNLEANILTFKSGFEGFWLGDPNAKYVCIYFHGGGYALDGDQSHLKFWESVQADLNNAGKSVATIFISYTLSSDQAYPTQICQGVEALNYFLEEKRRSASEVILGGDSAGGGIALAVLSQISHPSPDLPRVNLNGKLQAVVVMSPWISFNFDWPSFTSNEYKDCIPVTRLKAWSAEYKNGHPSNNYIEAVEAPAEWWEGAHVKQVLCTAGGDEILLDSIMAWVDKYKSVNPDAMTFVVGKNEWHIAPILEPFLGESIEKEQAKAIKAWMKARL